MLHDTPHDPATPKATVPLNRRPLPLDPTPRAAADARQWVGQVCRDLGRDDLAECAELGVSELVTNAILHAVPPLMVQVRGTRSHPRVEVFDASPALPDPPTGAGRDPHDFLATFGRGLSIVAMSAAAWGATAGADGKVVWFEPAPQMGDAGTEGVFDSRGMEEVPVPDDAVEVVLFGIDLPLQRQVSLQYAELRRELRLLALAHEDDYPLAADLSAMFTSFEGLFHPEYGLAMAAAFAAGVETIDVSVPMSPSAAPAFETMLEMFELADSFCRGEQLLSLQRTPVQRAFQEWVLHEFIDQLRGAEPRPWPGVPEPTRMTHAS